MESAMREMVPAEAWDSDASWNVITGEEEEVKERTFTVEVRGAVVDALTSAFAFGWIGSRSGELASAIIYGDVRVVLAFLSDINRLSMEMDATEWLTLSTLWNAVCDQSPKLWVDPCLAACVVQAFVRMGMNFGIPCEPAPVRRMFRQRPRWPLAAAIKMNPHLACALLDLPPKCSVQVNAKDDDGVWPIGYTNRMHITPCALRLFEQLLCRTDRNIVSAGIVDMDADMSVIHARASTHVLFSNILQCDVACSPSGELPCPFGDMARVFIAHAHPDGSGTDLTGGVPTNRCTPKHARTLPWHSLASFLPTKWGGALALVEALQQRWLSQPTPRRIFTGFAPLLTDLVQALRRIKAYRASIRPIISNPLAAGAIHSRDICSLTATYLLFALHDESQLQHPLLQHPHHPHPLFQHPLLHQSEGPRPNYI
jgi:hypothetical protein